METTTRQTRQTLSAEPRVTKIFVIGENSDKVKFERTRADLNKLGFRNNLCEIETDKEFKGVEPIVETGKTEWDINGGKARELPEGIQERAFLLRHLLETAKRVSKRSVGKGRSFEEEVLMNTAPVGPALHDVVKLRRESEELWNAMD